MKINWNEIDELIPRSSDRCYHDEVDLNGAPKHAAVVISFNPPERDVHYVNQCLQKRR